MNINDYLDEFATDWRLDGRAATTVELYAMHCEKARCRQGRDR